MKAIWIGALMAVAIGGPTWAQDATVASPKISVQLQSVPLREAIGVLFKSTGLQYSVDPEVTNVPVSLSLRDVGFEAALRMLIRQAGAAQPGLTFTKDGVIYRIRIKLPEPPDSKLETQKIPLQFLDVAEVEKQFSVFPIPEGITKMQPLRSDNSLLVHGTAEAIQQLSNIIRLIDVPARSLTIHVGVTGPGTGKSPLRLGSMARTLNAKEVVLEDETLMQGESARIRVQVKPIVQGDGQILTQSEWDLSVPVAGGPKGPIRLIKRLTTTARLHSSRGITVGEVDLAPFGGNGVVRLWLRATILPDAGMVLAVTDAGEALGSVEVLSGKAYLSAFALADVLNGRLRRDAGGNYRISPGASPDPNPGSLPMGDAPKTSGPFRLSIGDRLISGRMLFGVANNPESRLELNTGGDPLIPLEDLASALSARLEYDSARDAYQFRGGQRLSSLLLTSTGK